MRLNIAAFLAVAAGGSTIATTRCQAFLPITLSSQKSRAKTMSKNQLSLSSTLAKKSRTQLSLSSTLASDIIKKKTSVPPIETEEVYGTVVGDTKGAALRLDNVAISRGASSLLKNIDWSVQPNERWYVKKYATCVQLGYEQLECHTYCMIFVLKQLFYVH